MAKKKVKRRKAGRPKVLDVPNAQVLIRIPPALAAELRAEVGRRVSFGIKPSGLGECVAVAIRAWLDRHAGE